MESITTSLTGDLATTGWVALSLYMVLMLGIGVYCNRKFASSLDGFLLGGRSLGPWVFAITYGSTYISTAAFVGNAGGGYRSGMAFMLMPVAQVLLVPLGMLVFAPRLRVFSHKLNSMTIPELLGNRYKSKFMQFAGSLVIIVFVIPMMVSITKGGSVAVSQLLNISYTSSVFLVSGVALVYLMFGGFMARAYTDVIQGTLMFGGMLAILVIGLWSMGGPTGLANSLAEVNPELLETPGPIGWDNLLLFSSVFALAPWGLPQYVQTSFTIKYRRNIYAAALMLCFWFGVMLVAPVVVGNMSRATFGNALMGNVDLAFPAFALHIFPNAFGAIIIVAAVAAAMSSIDGILMTVGSAFGVDIYRRFLKKDATDKQAIWASNITMIVSISIVVLWALNPPDMMLYLVTVSNSLVSSGFIVPLFMAIWNRKATTGAGIASMIASVSTCLIWYFVGGQTLNGPYWFNLPPFVAASIVAAIVFLIAQNITPKMDKAFVDDLFSKETQDAAYEVEEA